MRLEEVTPQQDTRDRVIRLEANFASMNEKIDDQTIKIDEMYAVLMQAKGMKIILVLTAAIAGAIVTKLAPAIGAMTGS